MTRRDLIALLGSAMVSAPGTAMAQQAAGTRKVAVLSAGLAMDKVTSARIAAFRGALQALGWTDGKNIHFDYRYAGTNPANLRSAAAELVALAPDAIFANNTQALAAVRQLTRSIPIVFVRVADPVSQGFVASLARPGGNATGFTYADFAMGTKWLELLKEMAPRVARIALIFNPHNPSSRGFLNSVEVAAKSSGLGTIELPIEGVDDIDRIDGIGGTPVTGLIVLPDQLDTIYSDQLVKLAARFQAPALYGLRDLTLVGGLMSYDSDIIEVHKQAATYVDRILRGEKPGDLPVQNPTKYELVINLRTAKALSLTVPQSLLIRADELIK